MKRSHREARTVVVATFLLGMFAVLSSHCGIIDGDRFLGLETCDILNCDGIFFANLADDHDAMTGMDGMGDADAHDDEDDDHMAGVDDDDHDGDDEHMEDMDDHDEVGHDAEEEEHAETTEGDDPNMHAVE